VIEERRSALEADVGAATVVHGDEIGQGDDHIGPAHLSHQIAILGEALTHKLQRA
jgi:hypothetical protein